MALTCMPAERWEERVKEITDIGTSMLYNLDNQLF